MLQRHQTPSGGIGLIVVLVIVAIILMYFLL